MTAQDGVTKMRGAVARLPIVSLGVAVALGFGVGALTGVSPRSEAGRLHTQLTTARSEISSTESAAERLEAENQELQGENSSLETVLVEAQQEISALEARVSVPPLVGAQVEAVATPLEEAGLVVTSTRRPSDEPAGTILAQAPDGGEMVESGTEIQLVVAKSRPAPKVEPATVSEESSSPACDSSYQGVCIPAGSADLDCDDVNGSYFRVVGSDPHGFDGDGDGIGCES